LIPWEQVKADLGLEPPHRHLAAFDNEIHLVTLIDVEGFSNLTWQGDLSLTPHHRSDHGSPPTSYEI